MKNLKQFLLLLTLYFAIPTVNAVKTEYTDAMNALLKAPEFKEDARLSYLIYEYFLLESRFGIRTTPSPQIYKQGFNVAKNAEMWVKHVKPICDRLTDTYEDAKNANINEIEDYEDKKLFADATEIFREQFETSFFKSCREYKATIKAFNQSDVGIKFYMPRILKLYRQEYEDVKSQENSTVALYKALKDQQSGRYQTRINRGEEINTLLTWLDVIGDDKTLISEWRDEYQTVLDGWNALIKKHANNPKIMAKSALHADVYKRDDGDAIRADIALKFKDEYGLDVHSIVLMDNSKRLNQRRLIIQDDQLVGQNYASIAFFAIIDQGGNILSSHRGWYEEVGDEKPEIFIYQADNNFKSPRGDQTISTAEQKTHAEIRAENSARIAAESEQSRAETQAQVAEEVAAAKQAAEEESARLLADAQQHIDDAKTSVSSYGLIKLLSSLALIVAGLMTAASFIASRLPASMAATFNSILEKLKPVRGILGFVLLGLGAIGLLNGIIGFSLFAIVLSLLSIAVGAILSSANILGSLELTKAHIEKLQDFAMPVGLAALGLGILSLLGII
ncbi:hypothetical protein [Marinicella sp. W31]|uniref:hypothetical protein n=1 Tax=Marinicella sp. W31 TaxID=3023713 RepID=UPI003756FEE3